MFEGTIANIASSLPEPPKPDEFPDTIPAAPAPGLPKKLARFSRCTGRSQQFFTDKQVMGCLVREGKANQKRVDNWKTFIKDVVRGQ
jgi:hypothetical protein